ncbi:MAG: type I-C CRISPR-associated endonuclease Cas1 [Candidatus Schekmanbacteria bacterium]|nr:type I-C CRISPR-associated endonuclease Cas1 [Candidatus Schekmanbacteria bacterium]
MKTHQNTLYVTTQGSYLAREGESLLVRVDGETRFRVPIHTLAGVVCFGRVGLSPGLMDLCAERDVMVSFLSLHGKFLARVQGPVSGNVLLRREQYRRADDDGASAAIARTVTAAKIANCRTVLRRGIRDHAESRDTAALGGAAEGLTRALGRLDAELPLDTVRGIEGEAAHVYFGVFDELVTIDDPAFRLRGRSRRPPLDNLNALLSFVYTLLLHDVSSGLETVGLDPAVGYLHRDRPGRPGLALDLMEELRPVLADRLVLSLVNRRQVAASGFRQAETGGITMDDETRKTVLVAWQKRKDEEIVHPFLEDRMTMGLVPLMQARLFARYLRGDLDGYPPFLWR